MEQGSNVKHHSVFSSDHHRKCLTCGRLLENHRRRYCSQRCKEEFILKLKWYNNILRALKTKYATFYYNESYLILNILPNNKPHVFTYFYQRLPGRKPAQDMHKMVFELGDLWWGQRYKTKSDRNASEYILDQGHQYLVPYENIIPLQIKYISQVKKQMTFLKLDQNVLTNASHPQETIKSAYKKAAFTHHPDLGGSNENFRKIHQAYLDLMEWIKNPSYSTRRGLPGQWCYIALHSRWLSPL
ncbi:MAG TPA: hypothetical protein VKN82_03905 [Desulfohalobiaceae bacterium]|nr:hypothetical protein [Desulfohalobiaceae bacterium]